jgi:N-acetylmuramate 1-kinase
VEILQTSLAALGFAPLAVRELAGDASQRRFFRLVLTGGGTLVAALYPADAGRGEEQAARDHAVQVWGLRHGLPIPRSFGRHGRVVVSEDLGDEDLDRAAAAGSDVLMPALAALAAFQACDFAGLPTPPFDAPFFRRELTVFEAHAMRDGSPGRAEAARFLDELATAVAAHPFRLTHRDFHFNNLFWRTGAVTAVDYQDMRGGPDTYDLASLLRERGGAAAAADEPAWVERAAALLAWAPGWRRRYFECAAQRGVKVLGTFLRLAAAGRRGYLAWLPAVRARALAALAEVGAPPALADAVAAMPSEGL